MLCLGAERDIAEQIVHMLGRDAAIEFQRLHLDRRRLMRMGKMRRDQPQQVSGFCKERRALDGALPGRLRVFHEGSILDVFLDIGDDD